MPQSLRLGKGRIIFGRNEGLWGGRLLIRAFAHPPKELAEKVGDLAEGTGSILIFLFGATLSFRLLSYLVATYLIRMPGVLGFLTRRMDVWILH